MIVPPFPVKLQSQFHRQSSEAEILFALLLHLHRLLLLLLLPPACLGPNPQFLFFHFPRWGERQGGATNGRAPGKYEERERTATRDWRGRSPQTDGDNWHVTARDSQGSHKKMALAENAWNVSLRKKTRTRSRRRVPGYVAR